MRKVTLYTKPGCPLCGKAKGLLGALRAEGIAFELEEVDVTRPSGSRQSPKLSVSPTPPSALSPRNPKSADSTLTYGRANQKPRSSRT